MSEPFDGCWERLHRANSHRKAIAKLWDSLTDEDLYTAFVVDVNGKGYGVIRLHPKKLDAGIALQLGEILYQIRAALDGTIYAAAILDSCQDPPPHEDKLEFPIYRTKGGDDGFDGKKAQRKIKPLSDERKAIVESVQPYHGSALAQTIGRINDWARRDRHRRLHLVGHWASDASVELSLPAGHIQSLTVIESGFLEDEPKLAEFQLSRASAGTKFDINTKLSTNIAVMDSPPVMLTGTLKQMIGAASDIVEKFELSF